MIFGTYIVYESGDDHRELASLKCHMCECGFCFIFSVFIYFILNKESLVEFAFGSPWYDVRCTKAKRKDDFGVKVYHVSDAEGGWLKTDRRYYCIMSGFQGPPPPFGYQQTPYSGPYAQQVPLLPTEMLLLATYVLYYYWKICTDQKRIIYGREFNGTVDEDPIWEPNYADPDQWTNYNFTVHTI